MALPDCYRQDILALMFGGRVQSTEKKKKMVIWDHVGPCMDRSQRQELELHYTASAAPADGN